MQHNRTCKRELIFTGFFLCLIATLCLLPTGFEKQIYLNAEGAWGTVVAVNNEGIYNTGLIKQGEQRCRVLVKSGSFKGDTIEAFNLLTGKLEYDKFFQTGETVWLIIERDENDRPHFANMAEHYRLRKELVLIALFILCIALFSGFTGFKTILSFAFALLAIWKILIPLTLKGWPPIAVALVVGNALTVATLLLVAGFTPKAFAAIAGAVITSLATCLLAVVFGAYFNIHGAVMQWSESLLYAGFMHLDLTAIFQAGIYLSCSGAILDLAIDISAALQEVREHRPDISRKKLVLSGFTIGRSVVGSQISTLLLAYMGSYITVLMVYMAQGTPLLSILNSKMIAAEILHTFAGCIGLVLVCPLTSVISGLIMTGQKPSSGGNTR